MPQFETCWMDEVGDRWEAEGVAPGCIFEFHIALSPDCLPGGMVEVVNPGEIPTKPADVKRVLTRLKTGEEVGGGPGWPLFLTRWSAVITDLC